MKIQEAIIVEGKYDKIRLSSFVDALIVETNGFSVYKDPAKRAFLHALAVERGVIILTDSDNAGRQIRGYLTSFLPADRVKHAYIPDIPGKEKRKANPSKEGKLGVEGVDNQTLMDAILQAGAAVPANNHAPLLTMTDLYFYGLSGSGNCTARKRVLLQLLKLPENLSTKMLLRWIDSDEKLQIFYKALEKVDAAS